MADLGTKQGGSERSDGRQTGTRSWRSVLFTTLLCIAGGVAIGLILPRLWSWQTKRAATLAGRKGVLAKSSVFRIVYNGQSCGTGFLHRSGRVITAAHVVEGCEWSGLKVFDSANNNIKLACAPVADKEYDLALLTLERAIEAQAMEISADEAYRIGTQVSAWGYPGGYEGADPLLCVGYLAGMTSKKVPSGRTANLLVVNAAFNSGNSGGPLLSPADGTVIGVVVSKLAPMPKVVESALAALRSQRVGATYTLTTSEGVQEQMTEGQVTAMVLQHMRSQTQLVIGYAVEIGDLKRFLETQGIEP